MSSRWRKQLALTLTGVASGAEEVNIHEPLLHPGDAAEAGSVVRMDGEATASAVMQEIVPGFNKGDMADTGNYKYFALSCTLGKIIPRAMAERLYHIISDSLPESFFRIC